MVMSDLGAAGMMMIGVRDGRLPAWLLLDAIAPGEAPGFEFDIAFGRDVGPETNMLIECTWLPGKLVRYYIPRDEGCCGLFLFAACWFPSVTLLSVMPEKVSVVSMLNPCVSSLRRNCSCP